VVATNVYFIEIRVFHKLEDSSPADEEELEYGIRKKGKKTPTWSCRSPRTP
jgi:hypothetical protein